MPIYSYKATDATGKETTGTVEAASEELASDLLRERGLKISGFEIYKQDVLGFRFNFLQHISVKDLVVFARQLSVMISASVSLTKSLRILVRQTSNSKLRDILTDVADEVEGGVRLSDALAKHQKVFGAFYVNMIRSGETTGKLDEVLTYLADQQERDYDLRGRVKGAMIYPIFVMCMLVAVGAIMMIFVVPKLTAVLQESSVELPVTTRMLISTSNFVVAYWWLMFIVVFGAVAAIRWAYGKPAGRVVIDRVVLYIPVFGPLLRTMVLTRMTQGFSTLIAGGVDVVASLKVVANLVDNEVYRQALLTTVEEVGAGNTIANVWRTEKVFPQMVVQMVAVGEDTGRLQQVLERLTSFYTREVNVAVENLSKAVEPFIMVLMGVAVGGMVAAIILPMYSLAQQM